MVTTYEEIATLFDKLADAHKHLAELLANRKDVEYGERNSTLARAEMVHADACRRAAQALRGRRIPKPN
jgi:hypothetical protein